MAGDCPATDTGQCVYGPLGPNGERQCRFCGSMEEKEPINYDVEGIPVRRAVYADMKGKPLWTEEGYPFSNINGVGDFLVQNTIPYIVKRVAVYEGTMYTNVEREEAILKLEGRL